MPLWGDMASISARGRSRGIYAKNNNALQRSILAQAKGKGKGKSQKVFGMDPEDY